MRHYAFLVFIYCITLYANAFAAQPTISVATSIKPLHSLANNVLGSVGEATLLIKQGSPHHFQLKPSHMKRLQQSDLLFYIDDQFETALPSALQATTPSLHAVALSDAPIQLWHQRTESTWHSDHHAEAHSGEDYHIWLDPKNAMIIVTEMAQQLSKTYPQYQTIFQHNAQHTITRLQQLDAKVQSLLKPVSNQPFAVFHDGFQYFEKAYGLSAIGALTADPSLPTSAQRVSQLRTQLAHTKTRCMVSEPQFDKRIVSTLLEDTTITHIEIDPIGANLVASNELYFNLVEHIASTLYQCLTH